MLRNTVQISSKCSSSNCNVSEKCGGHQRLRETKGRHMDNIAGFIICAESASFLHLCLLLLLGLSSSLAAPQTSCILCNKEDLTPRSPIMAESYEEITFDHQVTREDAIQALRKYNETQITCNFIECSAIVLKYCLGPQFIKDHCCCELQHREEGLPYVPHICYSGEKVSKPSVGSCFHFEEVKQCCCASALVKEWRHISGASFTKPKTILSSLLVLLSLLHWRSRRR